MMRGAGLCQIRILARGLQSYFAHYPQPLVTFSGLSYPVLRAPTQILLQATLTCRLPLSPTLPDLVLKRYSYVLLTLRCELRV